MGLFSKIFRIKDDQSATQEEMERLAKEAAEQVKEPESPDNVIDVEVGLTPEQLAKEKERIRGVIKLYQEQIDTIASMDKETKDKLIEEINTQIDLIGAPDDEEIGRLKTKLESIREYITERS